MGLLLSVQLRLTCHMGDVILSHQILSVRWREVIQECVIVLVAAGAGVASKDALLWTVAGWPAGDLSCPCHCGAAAQPAQTLYEA